MAQDGTEQMTPGCAQLKEQYTFGGKKGYVVRRVSDQTNSTRFHWIPTPAVMQLQGAAGAI